MNKEIPKKRLFSQWTLPDRLAAGLAFIVFLFWSELLTYKYYSLGYYDWDLALYAQAMWNLTHGELFSSLFNMNFLANHAEYISFFLIPIYTVFQHPLTLVFLKIFSFITAGLVLYLLAKKSLPPALAILFMFLYFIFPANIYAMIYEFHFESLNVGLLFLLFYFFRERKVIPFYLTMFFTALIKENMPPIIVAFGLYSLFVKNRNKVKWALVPIVFGAAVFYVSMFLITPALRASLGSANQYLGFYHSLGATPFDILKTFFVHPEKIFTVIFKPYNLKFLDELLRPLAFLPILSPHVLFLGSPVFLQHLLSSSGQEHTIFYHYAATLAPFLFLAALESLRMIRLRVRPIFFYTVYGIMFLSCVVNLGYYRADLSERISRFGDSQTPVRWQMIEEIPADKGVIASLSFLAPVSQRKTLYSYLNALNGSTGLSSPKFELPDDVNYALLDLEDLWVVEQVVTDPAETAPRLRAFFNKGWELKDASRNDIVLLERNPLSRFQLEERSFTPFSFKAAADPIVIDDHFQFLGYEWGPKLKNRPHTLAFTFYWFAQEDINKMYKMVIRIKHNDKILSVNLRRIGYTIAATNSWQKGEYIKEYYWLALPALESGTYSVEILFVNSTEVKIAGIHRRGSSTIEKNNVLTLGTFIIP